MMDCPPPYEIQAQALYFTARETGGALAVQEGKVIRPAYKNHWGFHLQALFPAHHDGWKIGAAFTHFHARNRLARDGALQPIWPHPALVQPSDSLQAMWRLHLGFGDLFLQKRLQTMCLTPIFGLRGAGIRFKTLYDYESEELSMKNKFWGIGPRMGVEGYFWHFFARGAYSLLYGEFYLHQDDELTSGQKLKFKSCAFNFAPIKEAALGLFWNWRCLTFQAAWELYLMPAQGQWAQFTDAEMVAKYVTNLGSLMMQGLNFGLSVRF